LREGNVETEAKMVNIYERGELLRGLGHGRALEGLGVEHASTTHL
jgi:hypothetical protein